MEMNAKEKKRREDKAERICKMFGQLRAARTNWDSHWQEISERLWPQQSKMFQSYGGNLTEGEKRTDQFLDSTGAAALNKFGSILDSLLTPANQTWHRIKASNEDLMQDYEVRVWFDTVNRLLFKERYNPRANFSGNMQLYWKMIGAYGTATMFIDHYKGMRNEMGLRYKACHLSGIYMRENHQGIVDTVYRFYKVKAQNLVREFGVGKLPPKVVETAKDKPDTEFEMIHCVEPNMDYDGKRADHMGMLFSSTYVLFSEKFLVEEGGYNVFPYPSSRYEQVPNEVYGRGPAMDVLPSLKTLNEMKKTWLKQGHRATDPVLLIYDDGIMDQFSMKPGALNYGGVSADGRPLVHTLPVGNVQMTEELMDREGAFVKDSFLVNLMQILVDNPQQTATEVMERAKEKAILMAPTLGRQQQEALGGFVEREIDVMVQQKKLPPMPQLLMEARGEYGIVFESPLTRSARAEEAAGAMRTIEMALNYAGQTGDPSGLDHFDMDVIIPDVSDINGMPPKWRRSMDKISEIRDGRAQQQEREMQNQEAPGKAALVKSGATALKAVQGGGGK